MELNPKTQAHKACIILIYPHESGQFLHRRSFCWTSDLPSTVLKKKKKKSE